VYEKQVACRLALHPSEASVPGTGAGSSCGSDIVAGIILRIHGYNEERENQYLL